MATRNDALTRLEKYEDSLAKEGITEIRTASLPKGIRGACVRKGGMESIFLSGSENPSRAIELETLSHERCHLRLGALYRLGSPKAEIDRAERLARIASLRELLPLPYVVDAIFAKGMGAHEIALRAEVTDEFVANAISWYSDFEDFIKAKKESAKDRLP
ncbi:MAG: hypothetical protein LKK13_05160 [Bacilli bacterium]|nr:hypothetical protein [Bacilli bacterium]